VPPPPTSSNSGRIQQPIHRAFRPFESYASGGDRPLIQVNPRDRHPVATAPQLSAKMTSVIGLQVSALYLPVG
jgi:hypothetical protein